MPEPDRNSMQILNEPQMETLREIRRLLDGMHHADLTIRINGEDREFQADWIRYAVPLLMEHANVRP